jgi:hypothetical protein
MLQDVPESAFVSHARRVREIVGDLSAFAFVFVFERHISYGQILA